MPLTAKGKEILANLKKEYGSEKKAKEVLYAGENKGTFTGIHDDFIEPIEDAQANPNGWGYLGNQPRPTTSSTIMPKEQGQKLIAAFQTLLAKKAATGDEDAKRALDTLRRITDKKTRLHRALDRMFDKSKA